jgi:hypothetical protein
MKYPDAVLKTLTYIIIITTVIFALLHYMFRLLRAGGHDMTRSLADIADPRTANDLTRKTWNSKKKILEENPALKLEQKLEGRTKNHKVVTPYREVEPQYRSSEQKYQPV